MRKKSERIMNQIVDYIDGIYFSQRRVPSVAELGDAVGLSKGMVSNYLSDMELRGMITREGGFYGIRTARMKKTDGALTAIPVIGTIACGAPLFAEENVESYLTISGGFLGGGEYFILRAKGNSMIGAGIFDGDYVILRRQQTAEEGQIVAALIDGEEATLKRYFTDSKQKKIRLHPENPALRDLYYDHIDIQGVAVKIIRDVAL